MTATQAAVRATLVEALLDADALGSVEPERLTAFEGGGADVPFLELGVDSLTRVDLLVALELEHGVVVAPWELARFETLGALADHVERAAVPRDGAGSAAGGRPNDGSAADATDAPCADAEPQGSAPRQVRLFRRAFRNCPTVALLNNGLERFQVRLTPREFASFAELHRRGALLPDGLPTRFEEAVTAWLERLADRMRGSGTAEPEPFEAERLAPAAVLYRGPGPRAEKTLLICFATRGGRTLWMPQPIFLQHVDARRYDVLVLSDPWSTAFRTGVPQMGDSVGAVVRWVAGLDLLEQYRALRTYGCSGGAYPALLTARRVGAELAVGVAGRFPKEREFWTVVQMYARTWFAALRHRRGRPLLAFNAAKRRDARFARRVAVLTGASRLGVELPGASTVHEVLEPFLERGALPAFLARSLFAPADDPLVARRRAVATLSLSDEPMADPAS